MRIRRQCSSGKRQYVSVFSTASSASLAALMRRDARSFSLTRIASSRAAAISSNPPAPLPDISSDRVTKCYYGVSLPSLIVIEADRKGMQCQIN